MGNSKLRVFTGRGTVWRVVSSTPRPWNLALAHLHVLALRGALPL